MRFLLFYIFLLTNSALLSQIFEVDVSNNLVSLNESFTISFSVNQSASNFLAPSFSDFQIIRGPSKSSSTSIINGDITKKISYTYELKPKKIGVFTILPASIKVRNKTIGSRPITIQVKRSTASSSKPNTPYNIANRNVHLVVFADKSKCYTGQPVVLTYKLYFNLNVGNLNPQSIAYSNFWTENIENINSTTKKETFKGKTYNSAIIKQIVVLPQSHGIQEIDPFSVDMTVNVPTNKRDFFGMQATQAVAFTATSNKLSLDVLPLPSKNIPKDFSGALGFYDLNVSIDRDSLNVNQSATLSVSVKGSGNLNLIKLPEVKFDSELEVYDPKVIEKITVSNNGVSGYIRHNFLIVPRHKGDYNLKSISFSFFNPLTKEYVSLKSNDIKLKVGGVSNFYNSETQTSVKKEKIDLINEDIKFIKMNYKKNMLGDFFAYSNLFYVLLFIPFLLALILILLIRLISENKLLFKLSSFRKFKNRITKIQPLLKKKLYAEFQSELLLIMFDYASDRFLIKKSNLSSKFIAKKLTSNGVSELLSQEYIEMISYLEMCKYSTNEGDKLNKDMLIKVTQLINKIESEL